MPNNQTHKRSLGRYLACVSAAMVLSVATLAGPVAAQSAPAQTLALPDFTEVVARTESSVVNIRTTEAVRVRNPNHRGTDPYDMFRWFFGPDFMPPGMPRPDRRGPQPPAEQERTVPRGVGSGFIISEDGYILTNDHVVARANGVFVTLTSGKEYKAEIIGTDPRTDVALIKIDAKGLVPLPIGDSNTLKKGQWVLAIGSPFGLDSTVTSGIVSAINRDTGDYLPFIQTDVAVNPGNSGGPLINLAGEVVGVNSQIVSQSGGFMGISLAIPIDEVMRVVEQLKAHGKVTRGRIGVQVTNVSDDVAQALGLDSGKGALVSNVEPGGPAEKAGVQSGDVIVRFDGTDIARMADLPRLVGSTKPGSRSSLEVWRKGKNVKLTVTIGEMPSADDESPAGDSGEPEAMPVDVLGLRVAALSEQERADAGVSRGVVVVDAEGPAAQAGIAQGDIILVINDVDITDPAQYARVVSGLPTSRAAAVLVMRDSQSQWFAITPRK